jgi:hypothetical protein
MDVAIDDAVARLLRTQRLADFDVHGAISVSVCA